ncbi:MAG: S-layer homology domain-containing protein, partial [Clostridia bacterium]|nr:S-layer homology domain-containing protein [Clostridia bacterium]
ANRAWVVRLLVRLIGKEKEALNAEGLPAFTDSYLIPNWATGYVKVAQDYNLVGGYADNTFRPERAVTRAELAALLSRAQEYLEPSPLSIKGTVQEVSTSRLTISDSSGQKRTFILPYDTPIYDDSTLISSSELWPYDRVLLITDGENIKYIEKLSAEAVASVVSGSVRRVYSEEGALVIETASGEYRTLYLPPESSLDTGSATWEVLHTLQPGDQVEVTLNNLGYISGLVINSRSQEAFKEGVVYDLYLDGNLITLRSDSGKLSSFRLAEQVQVTMKGQRFAALTDVRQGDRVRLEIENSNVVGIEVLEVAFLLDLEGTVVAVSPQDRIITLDVDGQLKAFRVTAAAEIAISGLVNAGLADVAVGDQVKAHIDNGVITRLTVQDRSITNSLHGTVVSVDTYNRILTLRDKQDNLHAYEVKSNARIVINGDDTSLGNIKKDMQVEIRLVDGKIVYLEVDNTPEGTVVSLDDKGLLLVLADSEGRRTTYVIDENVDIDSEDGRDDLDEIKRGDYVEITLKDDVVTKIKLYTELLLRVESVREDYDRIDTRDKDGDRVRLYITGNVELIIPGIKYPDVEDLRENDIVKACYLGYELQKVELLQPRQGQVTAINYYNNTVTLKYSEGDTDTINFDRYSKLIIDGKRYDSLERLNRYDYVEVIENLEGGYDIKVL